MVDDKKTEFFYIDSGNPGGDVYTTLIIVHGHTFHSGSFNRILPLASSKGLRIVCLNRRDYAPTTLYSPSELKVLSEGTETERVVFLQSRGIELAQFLNRLIDELSLPAPTAEGNDGGLALLGWSLGNTATLATIASASCLSTEVQQRLQLYLRRLILLEPPCVALGIKDPPKGYGPLHDGTIPPAERGAAFVKWVSSYFTHGDLSTRDPDILNYRNPSSSREPSVSNMSPEEFNSMVDFAPGERSDSFLSSSFYDDFAQQTQKALFDPTTRALWPNLDVWHVHGDAPSWNPIYAAWEIERQAKAFGEQTVKFSVIKGANHFVFWDDPKTAINAFRQCLRT